MDAKALLELGRRSGFEAEELVSAIGLPAVKIYTGGTDLLGYIKNGQITHVVGLDATLETNDVFSVEPHDLPEVITVEWIEEQYRIFASYGKQRVW